MLTAMETIKNIMDNLVILGLGVSGVFYLVKGITKIPAPAKRQRKIKVHSNSHDKAA